MVQVCIIEQEVGPVDDARVQVYAAAVEGQGQGAGWDNLSQVVGVNVGELEQVDELGLLGIAVVHHRDHTNGDSGHGCIVKRKGQGLCWCPPRTGW